MTKKLMKIQDEDAQRMADGGDLPNYSKAGTGKTLSTLEAFKRAGHKRGLVLCPQIALAMWEQEIKEWLGADVQVVRKSSPIKGNPDFVVSTFDLAGRPGMRPLLYKEFSAGALILDEAHYLRRHTSKRTCAVFGDYTDGAGGLSENFDQIWSLTGNPILRHHDDLWSQIAPLYPDVLERYGCATYDAFVRNFCFGKVKKFHERMQPKWTIIGSQNEAIINRILYTDIGAIRRMEAPDLPELVEEQLYPKLGAVPAEYGRLVNKMSEADLLKALISPDDKLSMQQIWQAVALAKVKGSVEYLMECANDAPVLIGVWHNSVGEAYRDALESAGARVKRVYGATPAIQREYIRDEFNRGDLDFIVGQMQAMGVSWNLQELANRVIVAQDHYSPGVIEQFYKRVYRTGQKRTTYLGFLTSNHPLDRVISKMRNARERSQERALDL